MSVGMSLSVFDDGRASPTDRALQKALGKAGPAWATLRDTLLHECDSRHAEWAFASAKFGWSLRVKRGKRVIVYMTPCKNYFLASFALGEKACAAAREADLPASILTLIADAPKFAEGRGVRIPVRTKKDASAIRTLAAIKLAH
jgi:hypothetical protein